MKLNTKVLVTQEIHPKGMELLQKHINQIVVAPKDDKETILSLIDDEVEGVIVRYNKFDRDMIAAAKNLKVIARHGIGVELIDLHAAREKGVLVVNTPDAATNSVAEHVIMMVLMLAKKIDYVSTQFKHGNYAIKSSYGPTDVQGKTIGFIGLGRIGLLAAEKCHCLGLKVIAFDPFLTPSSAPPFVSLETDMHSLLMQSDFVSLHVPLTDETNNLIGKNELSLMKPTAFLINCARGGVVNERDLIDALDNKIIAGAGLDVFETEPPKIDNPLLHMDNVVVTPHSSALTEDGKIKMAIGAVEQLLDVLQNKTPKHIVRI